MSEDKTPQQVLEQRVKRIESRCWRELALLSDDLLASTGQKVQEYKSAREIFGFLNPQWIGIHTIAHVCADEEHFYQRVAQHESLHQYDAPLRVLMQAFFLLDMHIVELMTRFPRGHFSAGTMIHASEIPRILVHHGRHDHDWKAATLACALEKVWQIGLYKALRAEGIPYPEEYHPHNIPKHVGPIPKEFQYTVPKH